MKKIIKRFHMFNYVLAFLAGLLILIAGFLTTFEVIMRYFFDNPTNWTYSISQYLLLGIAFFSLTYTFQQRGHIGVDFVMNRVNKKVGKGFNILSLILVFTFAVVVVWLGVEQYLVAHSNHYSTMGGVSIPSSWLYAVIIFGFVLLITGVIIRIMEEMILKTDK